MKEVLQKIEQAHHIALLTHIDPDADTLGSALGMFFALKSINKRATVVSSGKLPYNLKFLPGVGKIKKELPDRADLWISFDCGSFDRLGVEQKGAFLINIDHHASNTLYGDINIVKPSSASTSQVVYEVLKALDLPIPKQSAICFYTALVDDTGFFKYNSVNSEVFLVAKELCDLGAVPEEIAVELTMREPLAKLRLIELMLQSLQLHLLAKVAIVYLTQEMLAKSGATKEMGESALDMARSLATVEVAVMLRQEEDARIKVSLRSKSKVDVGKIAVMFGGGGHKRAAGFTVTLQDFSKVEEQILKVLSKELNIEEK